MSSTVIQFPHSHMPFTEVAQYLRIGGSHRNFGSMHAQGYAPVKRVVVEASRLTRQGEFIKVMQSEGVEIVLDTEAAELSSHYRFKTNARNAEWLAEVPKQPLIAEDFTQERIDAIALLAVKYGVNTVLAPTHYLKDQTYRGWLRIDLINCERLRRSLDKLGGADISIDYTVIQSAAGLADEADRKMLNEGLSSMPVEQIWFRVSGLGKEAGPQKTRTLIQQLSGFHNLGMPIVLDYCNGLNAQAALAFGAVSGVSFGVMELDQFDASSWHKPMPERDPDKSDKYGRRIYIAVPGLGRSFEKKEFELLAQAKGGRRIMLQSEHISATSVDQMARDRKPQAALQAIRSFEQIERIPDLNRPNFFLNTSLKDTERRAGEVSRLQPTQAAAEAVGVNLPSLLRRTSEHYGAIVKLAIALEKLHEDRGQSAVRARPCRKHDAGQVGARRDEK